MLGIRSAVDVLAGTLVVLAASWSAGCGKSGAANPDGGDGSLTVPDAPVAGRRSFDMIAVLTPDGSTALPPNNRFTLVLDADARLAIVGGNGRGAVVGVTSNDGRTFRSTGPFSVGGDGDTCSGTEEIRYDSLEVTLAGGSLTGSASGAATVSCGDCLFFVQFGATLTGTTDVTPPQLRGAAFQASTPFDPVALIASEPLPVGVTARLIADDGAAIELVPSIVDGEIPLVVGFTKPDVVLRAGQGYAVPPEGLVDFAGQTDRAGPALRLVSFADAPAVAEDGFEAATGSVLGGALVMTAGGLLPPIAGNTSLYVGNPGAPGLDTTTGRSLAVRLPRQAGDAKLRFSYRHVSTFAQLGFSGSVHVGSEGASPGTPTYALGSGTAVTEMITIAGKPAYTSPAATAELTLPADAKDEVLVVIAGVSSFCGRGLIGAAGLLIDDLRLE